MRVGLLTTAIFGDLSGYFFGNFRDKADKTIVFTTVTAKHDVTHSHRWWVADSEVAV